MLVWLPAIHRFEIFLNRVMLWNSITTKKIQLNFLCRTSLKFGWFWKLTLTSSSFVEYIRVHLVRIIWEAKYNNLKLSGLMASNVKPRRHARQCYFLCFCNRQPAPKHSNLYPLGLVHFLLWSATESVTLVMQ